jgi:ferric-dicitrate binding protein FerR (iron transport regulator)
MELTKMPIKLFARKLLRTTSHFDELKFQRRVIKNPYVLKDYQFIQRIWEEAGSLQAFEQIDILSDWQQISKRMNYKIPSNYRRISRGTYFLRIAALLLLTFGLSYGFYRVVILKQNTSSGFTTYYSDKQIQDIILPDGSTVALNTRSRLTFREGFGTLSREVILEGEGFFSVVPGASLPFKVFSGGSLVEVTGTKFSVCEMNGAIHVSVLSGTVMLSSTDILEHKISITANQSGYLLNNNELKVEDRIPVNELSWKTGHLIFDQTPLDSALKDIARHFRKELSFDTALEDDITAEFQDQPLHEILKELELVAGLQFDTTGNALIVRK